MDAEVVGTYFRAKKGRCNAVTRFLGVDVQKRTFFGRNANARTSGLSEIPILGAMF